MRAEGKGLMKNIFRMIPVLITAGILISAKGVRAQDMVRLDLSADWMRRDWDRCRSGARLILKDGVATIMGDTSAVLFWQVPTRNGPLRELDMDQKWIQGCNRPPPEFGKELRSRDQDRENLLQVRDYRYVSWRWLLNGTIDDTKKGRKPEEKFTARLGITILRKGGDDLREIAYVWTRTLPEGTVFVYETTVIPGVWKYRWHRIVAESRDADGAQWVEEARDLYADYKRMYPKEEPGRVVRVYLRVDSETPENRIKGSFSDIVFCRYKPE